MVSYYLRFITFKQTGKEYEDKVGMKHIDARNDIYSRKGAVSFLSNSKGKIIFVVGAPKSGVNLLTQCLRIIGMCSTNCICNDLQDYSNLLNKQLLEEFACDPYTVNELPAGWIKSVAVINAKKRLQSFLNEKASSAHVLVFGEEITPMLMPLWLEATNEINVEKKIVHIIRHPWEVAQVMMKEEIYDLDACFKMWFKKNIEALQLSNEIESIILLYDDFLQDPYRVIKFVANKCELKDGNVSDISAGNHELHSFIQLNLFYDAVQVISNTESDLYAVYISLYEKLKNNLKDDLSDNLTFKADELAIGFNQARVNLRLLDQLNQLELLISLSKAYRLSGYYHNAERVMSIGLFQSPDNANAHLEWAEIALYRNDIQEAINRLMVLARKLGRKCPWQIYLQLGKYLRLIGETDQANNSFTRALESRFPEVDIGVIINNIEDLINTKIGKVESLYSIEEGGNVNLGFIKHKTKERNEIKYITKITAATKNLELFTYSELMPRCSKLRNHMPDPINIEQTPDGKLSFLTLEYLNGRHAGIEDFDSIMDFIINLSSIDVNASMLIEKIIKHSRGVEDYEFGHFGLPRLFYSINSMESNKLLFSMIDDAIAIKKIPAVASKRIKLLKEKILSKELYHYLNYPGNYGLVHGDLKGQNIIINQEATIKVLDWSYLWICPRGFDLAPLFASFGCTFEKVCALLLHNKKYDNFLDSIEKFYLIVALISYWIITYNYSPLAGFAKMKGKLDEEIEEAVNYACAISF